MTAAVPRAYAIADAFWQRGIPVVMDGIHPALLPDEAGAHADGVAAGDVVEEAQSLPGGWVGSVDDNIAGHTRRERCSRLGGEPADMRWLRILRSLHWTWLVT